MPISGKLYVWEDRAKYAPATAGVYAFHNDKKDVIFFGGTGHLRETFENYIKNNFSVDPRKCKTIHYKREPIENWKERMAKLIEEYNQKYGEPPRLNFSENLPVEKVVGELGFRFYEDLDRPLQNVALDLGKFKNQVKEIPISSLVFHQDRGDFARWVGDVFKQAHLADRIAKIGSNGETLREDLLIILSDPLMSECPKCRDETKPIKQWEMTGKPFKNGEKLRLTIGFYKCKNCQNAFRKVIKKERIKPDIP